MTAKELSALMRKEFASKTPEELAEMERLGKEMEEAGLFRLMGDSEK